CLFLFQAEDGIRDGHVTGVQTCALPIFLRWFSRNSDSQHPADQPPYRTRGNEHKQQLYKSFHLDCPITRKESLRILQDRKAEDRSEERRVGKEGRKRKGTEE